MITLNLPSLRCLVLLRPRSRSCSGLSLRKHDHAQAAFLALPCAFAIFFRQQFFMQCKCMSVNKRKLFLELLAGCEFQKAARQTNFQTVF
jgi:hypothetical protein